MSERITIYVSAHWRTAGVVETTTDSLDGVDGFVQYPFEGKIHGARPKYVFLEKEAAYADARARRIALLRNMRKTMDDLLAIPLGGKPITTVQTKSGRQPRTETLQTLRLVQNLRLAGEKVTASLVYHNLQNIRPISRSAAFQQLKLMVKSGKLEYSKQGGYGLTKLSEGLLERYHHDL